MTLADIGLNVCVRSELGWAAIIFPGRIHATHQDTFQLSRPMHEPQFNALLFRRAWPWFYAFDVLWLDGEDWRSLPHLERKPPFRRLVPRGDSRLLYVDHVARRGREPKMFGRVYLRDPYEEE